MAQYTVLEPAEIAGLAYRFGLPTPDQVTPEPKGRVNTSYHLRVGGDRWFLRVVEGKGQAELAFELEVLRYLFSAQFPVPRLVQTIDGQPAASVRGKPVLLFTYATGEAIHRAEAGPDRCRRIGEQLGRLHELSAGFTEDRENPTGPARVAAWLDPIERAGLADPEVKAALPMLRQEVEAAGRLPGAPRGLCHGDLFIDNVHWVGDRVSYLLDWEMACVEPFAWDLAVTLDAWCFTERYEPARIQGLLQGYRSRRKLDADTLAALPAFARFAATRFAVSRLFGTLGPQLPGDRMERRDWRRYRDRLLAQRALGLDGFRALLA